MTTSILTGGKIYAQIDKDSVTAAVKNKLGMGVKSKINTGLTNFNKDPAAYEKNRLAAVAAMDLAVATEAGDAYDRILTATEDQDFAVKMAEEYASLKYKELLRKHELDYPVASTGTVGNSTLDARKNLMDKFGLKLEKSVKKKSK